ncbi:hypothetical protein [Rubinisphaera sp.]|uniref:hypothetical protein n=1 Tax=Rubinisphaera sp. TaxID=2024857 RepID=UPI000C103605|nr:hypothetical protein [Rubinisphaera sp.]MBV08432.1 hypothetical protein [Rubinisphaera sp.]|tara:strand:+ start:102 stop:1094 length:993 start_codon:yes stop_codon:yes gene_type:complete
MVFHQVDSSRQIIIGMDEAGYGPKLGPLVIAVSAWSMPKRLTVEDLWTQLDDVLTNKLASRDKRLHVGDSKQVYSSTKGIASLERSVLSLMAACQIRSLNLTEPAEFFTLLTELLGKGLPASFSRQPWYDSCSISLPLKARLIELSEGLIQLNRSFQKCELQLEQMQVDVVCPERFNSLIQQYGNKSEVLTRLSMALVKDFIPPKSVDCQVLADKHGGRSRYLPYLLDAFPDRFLLTERESQEQSRYRDDSLSLSFSVKSERFLPVAVASMTAKYVREVCMEAFNRYWKLRTPEVKPTKGYPVDAARFRQQIDRSWEELQLPESILWRDR